VYHDASPVATSRPNPDGSLYSDVILEDATMVPTTVPTAHVNSIRGPFRSQHGFKSLSSLPSDHRTLQLQVRNLRTQLAAAEASFRSPMDAEPSIDDLDDHPCPGLILSDFEPLYGCDDDDRPPDTGESVTSHASSIESTSAAAAAPPTGCDVDQHRPTVSCPLAALQLPTQTPPPRKDHRRPCPSRPPALASSIHQPSP
jgi:hypothetical protein